MKKFSKLAVIMAGLTIGAAAHAETLLGFTIYKYDDNFMSAVRKAIEKEGEQYKDIKLLMNDSQNDQSKQNDQIDVLISKGVKALAINLVDPAAAPVVIQKAKEEDIPVVFYNKEPSKEALASYDKAYYVGTDSKESGIIQGDIIAKQWAQHPEWDLNKDGVIDYVLLKGEPGHPDAEARTTYVTKTLVESHGIKVKELHMDTAMWDTAMAKDKADAWLSGPNGNKIEVIIANNDAMAMGAVEATKAHGKKVPVFGVDALPEALTMIGNGQMAGTVLNDATNQAKATFELAKNLAEGKPAGEGTQWNIVDKIVRVPYVGVDKDNLSQFK